MSILELFFVEDYRNTFMFLRCIVIMTYVFETVKTKEFKTSLFILYFFFGNYLNQAALTD